MTGVSPVTLDDVTSGFNIGWHISTKKQFNQMLGFSTEDVYQMFNYYKEKGEIAANANIDDIVPARMITDPQVFPSLLFYYGMLTIKATRGAKLILGIPNNNVRKQYDKYLSTDMLQPQE